MHWKLKKNSLLHTLTRSHPHTSTTTYINSSYLHKNFKFYNTFVNHCNSFFAVITVSTHFSWLYSPFLQEKWWRCSQHHATVNMVVFNMLVNGDSWTLHRVGLRRYPNIGKKYFRRQFILVWHALWRAGHIDLPNSTKIVILQCSTNNTDQDRPSTIANGIMKITLFLLKKSNHVKLIITGLLPWNKAWLLRRKK